MAEDHDHDLEGYNSFVNNLQNFDASCNATEPSINLFAEENNQSVVLHPVQWADRCKTTPHPGTLRLLTEPAKDAAWSTRDFSLTQWLTTINTNDKAAPIFYANQRLRWLAKMALNKWRYTLWSRKTQCNVDMIDMAPVKATDAIFVTDVANRHIYRFHRRDVFNSLISNICMSDEMMPYPRPPTNPWTNQILTLGQTISVCEQLVGHYGRQGRCPPVLFAAFCASRYDVDRFQRENSSLLAQHAIVAYFKDLTPENSYIVEETMTNLLNDAGLDFSPTAIRRWLATRPMTPLHREWVTFVQDYTLYINLHVQVRDHWTTRRAIRLDVAELYSRTTIPPPTRANRSLQLHPGANMIYQLQNIIVDPSGADFNENLAIQLIRNALFNFQR